MQGSLRAKPVPCYLLCPCTCRVPLRHPGPGHSRALSESPASTLSSRARAPAVARDPVSLMSPVNGPASPARGSPPSLSARPGPRPVRCPRWLLRVHPCPWPAPAASDRVLLTAPVLRPGVPKRPTRRRVSTPLGTGLRGPSAFGPWCGGSESLAPASGPRASVALAGAASWRLTGHHARQPSDPRAGSRAVGRASRQHRVLARCHSVTGR